MSVAPFTKENLRTLAENTFFAGRDSWSVAAGLEHTPRLPYTAASDNALLVSVATVTHTPDKYHPASGRLVVHASTRCVVRQHDPNVPVNSDEVLVEHYRDGTAVRFLYKGNIYTAAGLTGEPKEPFGDSDGLTCGLYARLPETMHRVGLRYKSGSLGRQLTVSVCVTGQRESADMHYENRRLARAMTSGPVQAFDSDAEVFESAVSDMLTAGARLKLSVQAMSRRVSRCGRLAGYDPKSMWDRYRKTHYYPADIDAETARARVDESRQYYYRQTGIRPDSDE